MRPGDIFSSKLSQLLSYSSSALAECSTEAERCWLPLYWASAWSSSARKGHGEPSQQPGCSWGSSETSSVAAAGSGLCSAAGFGSSGSRSLTNHANSSAKTLTQQAQGLVTCVTCVPRPRVPHSSQTPSTQLHQPHAALGAASPTRPWAQAGAESSGGRVMSSSSATAVCVPWRCC